MEKSSDIKNMPILNSENREVKITNFKEYTNDTIEKIQNNPNIVEKFGKSEVSNYSIEIKNKSGYGEWWDKEVSENSKSTLIICNDNLQVNELDFKYTLYHEVYPGHAHFYSQVLKSKTGFFDNGSMFVLEGYATFTEWNILKSNYTHNLKVNACKFLHTILKNDLESAIKILFKNVDMKNSANIDKLIRISQYPLFQESYYLGALAIEIMMEENVFKTPSAFLKFLNKTNCGDFFQFGLEIKQIFR